MKKLTSFFFVMALLPILFSSLTAQSVDNSWFNSILADSEGKIWATGSSSSSSVLYYNGKFTNLNLSPINANGVVQHLITFSDYVVAREKNRVLMFELQTGDFKGAVSLSTQSNEVLPIYAYRNGFLAVVGEHNITTSLEYLSLIHI